MPDAMEEVSKLARLIRLLSVRTYWQTGELTKSEAQELLSGPLTPGDGSTVVDDSNLLEQEMPVVRHAIGLPPEADAALLTIAGGKQ